MLAVLMTANFKDNSVENLDRLLELQPDRPILVSEYWSGWFDHWYEPRHNDMTTQSETGKKFRYFFCLSFSKICVAAEFEDILGTIFDYQGSVNFYMFHGGTNFGFLNGANVLENVWPHYVPTITSYGNKYRKKSHFDFRGNIFFKKKDYDGPLSEQGNYTEKYYSAQSMVAAQDPLSDVVYKQVPK